MEDKVLFHPNNYYCFIFCLEVKLVIKETGNSVM